MKKIKPKKMKIHKIEHVLEDFCSKEKKFYTEPYDIEEFAKSLGFQLIPKELPFEDNSILKVDLRIVMLRLSQIRLSYIIQITSLRTFII